MDERFYSPGIPKIRSTPSFSTAEMRRSEPSYAHSFHVTAASKRHAAHPTEAGYRTALPKRRNFQTLQEHEGRITWPSRDALTIGANSTRLTCWQD